MKSIKLLSLSLVAAAALAGQAQAGSISYSNSFTWKLTDLTGFSGVNPATLSLQKFNLTGQVLTGVSITFTADISTGGNGTPTGTSTLPGSTTGYTASQYGTITNTSSVNQSPSVTLTANSYTATAAAGSPAALGTTTNILSPFTLVNGQSYTNIAPGATVQWGPASIIGHTTVLNFSGSQLVGFTGSGTLDWGIGTLTSQAYTGGAGNFSSAINTAAQASVSVVYTYTKQQVPAPAPLFLLAGGALAMGFVRRNKRKSL